MKENGIGGKREKAMVVTQISVGGFANYVTEKMLLDYFVDYGT